MTNLQNKSLYILLFCIILLSCTQKRSASIVIRSNTIYDRHSSYNNNKYTNNKYNHSTKTNNSNVRSIIVAKGHTVYDIAKANKVLIRDLISENHLKPPYILKIGDTLTLPQAKYYKVVLGDNLYDISRTYNMNINDLIALNHLKFPYTIKVGDKLKMASSSSGITNNANANLNYKSKPAGKSKNSLGPHKYGRFIWPVRGKIISKFGRKSAGLYNDGINIKASNNDPIKVVENGTVAYVGNELRGYGNLIIVKHSGNWISAYAHLNQFKVKRGDKVTKGSIIATVGATGNVDYPQLYFGIRRGREAVNPENYLKKSLKS